MYGEVPWLLTAPSIATIGREITMSAVREWAASQNGKILEAVAVNSLGKWKTATQMIALTVLVAARDTSLAGYVFSCFWCAFALHLCWSFPLVIVVYMRKYGELAFGRVLLRLVGWTRSSILGSYSLASRMWGSNSISSHGFMWR
ncbi:putative cardiolipin synthase (CMP-forming), mitochondrial [Iris pallida]|uniref:Cardiolipin synthase (CMP-forming), mitochondrial n=1 Tax=Iris pallida TaxID=29817 RepID=A0AAX6HL85_IRIPA|nr:putative cardiolipin synthase (CMP-forming), mitochondrial [Iris pallida]